MNPQTAHDLILQPRDPLLLRDARPFTADPGGTAFTLDWPLPQTVAGMLRTHIGNTMPAGQSFDWSDHGPAGGPAKARAIAVRGPLLLARGVDERRWRVFLRAPADAVLWGEKDDDGVRERNVMRLRPAASAGEGDSCDLPIRGLKPALPEKHLGKHLLIEGPQFWAIEDVVSHLAGKTLEHPRPLVLAAIPRETRVHVRIDPSSRTYEEGALFSTTALAFAEEPLAPSRVEPEDRLATALLCRVEKAPPGWVPAERATPFGAERRITMIRPDLDGLWPAFDANALPSGISHLLLYLATPALFKQGWLPGWIDPESRRGTPPWLPDVMLQLESACITNRRVPVSGWDLERRAPRPIRFAVPAGSVYFFRVVDGVLSPAAYESIWLQPVSDDDQDCRDGYGLALPGAWDLPVEEGR